MQGLFLLWQQNNGLASVSMETRDSCKKLVFTAASTQYSNTHMGDKLCFKSRGHAPALGTYNWMSTAQKSRARPETVRRSNAMLHPIGSSPQLISTGSFPYELSLSAPAGWSCRAEAGCNPPCIVFFFFEGEEGEGLRDWTRRCNTLCTSSTSSAVRASAWRVTFFCLKLACCYSSLSDLV